MPAATRTDADIVASFTRGIDDRLREFEVHSRSCALCRNPIVTYESRQQLCIVGQVICRDVVRLLYTKAEHIKSGRFTVDIEYGWQAADGLIRIITHNKQGFYGNEILDLKRAHPASETTLRPPKRIETSASEPRYIPAPAPVARGSGWSEDEERLNRSKKSKRSSAEYVTASHARRSDYNAIYGNPNTSYKEIQQYTPQAASSNADTHSDSRLSASQRSVKFDRKVKVREYDA